MPENVDEFSFHRAFGAEKRTQKQNVHLSNVQIGLNYSYACRGENTEVQLDGVQLIRREAAESHKTKPFPENCPNQRQMWANLAFQENTSLHSIIYKLSQRFFFHEITE